jgi:hypothetical protein
MRCVSAAMVISAMSFSSGSAQAADRSDFASTRGAPPVADEGGVILSLQRLGRWGETSRRNAAGIDVATGFRTIGAVPFFGAQTLLGLRAHDGGGAVSYSERIGAGVQLGPVRAQTLLGVQVLGASKLDDELRLVLFSPSVGLSLGATFGVATVSASVMRGYEWRYRDVGLDVTRVALELIVLQR